MKISKALVFLPLVICMLSLEMLHAQFAGSKLTLKNKPKYNFLSTADTFR